MDARSCTATGEGNGTSTSCRIRNLEVATPPSALEKPEKEEEALDLSILWETSRFALIPISLCNMPCSADVTRHCMFTCLVTAEDAGRMRSLMDNNINLPWHSPDILGLGHTRISLILEMSQKVSVNMITNIHEHKTKKGSNNCSVDPLHILHHSDSPKTENDDSMNMNMNEQAWD